MAAGSKLTPLPLWRYASHPPASFCLRPAFCSKLSHLSASICTPRPFFPPPSFLPFLVFILALPWFQLFYLLISFSIRSPRPSLCLLLWCLSVQSQLCLPLHILEERGLPQVAVTVGALLNLAPPRHSSTAATPTTPSTPPGPSVTI